MTSVLNRIYFGVRSAAISFFYDEEGDVNIVSMVVLMGIVIILAVVFKDAVKNLLTTLFNKITTSATDAIEGN